MLVDFLHKKSDYVTARTVDRCDWVFTLLDLFYSVKRQKNNRAKIMSEKDWKMIIDVEIPLGLKQCSNKGYKIKEEILPDKLPNGITSNVRYTVKMIRFGLSEL